jgi:peptidoglycan/xylan/chitin deacetylase (PgdA/CDA1 family)
MADTLVLCYHALSEHWPADLSARPGDFRAQLEHLARRGYRGVTFSEAVRDAPRGRRVAVTFDDAFRSVAELALPILERLRWPATVFAVSDFARSGGLLRWPGIDHWAETPHRDELAGLSWAELRTLVDAGWEVGSHTRTHPRLTTLSDAEVAAELTESRAACEDGIGMPCESLAYPYGDVDPRVVAATRDAGYAAGAALPARWHRAEPLHWPRVGVYHPDDLRRFRLKTSRATRRLRSALRR